MKQVIVNGIEVTESSGNVFDDLSLPNPEAGLAKAQLAAEIYRTIKEQGLTQMDAASKMGIIQGDVSLITNGKLSKFTLDRLVRCLDRLGKGIEITTFDKLPVEAAAR